MLYREIKQSLTDLGKMFTLMEREREIADLPGAQPLKVDGANVTFRNVNFAYEAARPILHDISFEIPAGDAIAQWPLPHGRRRRSRARCRAAAVPSPWCME